MSARETISLSFGGGLDRSSGIMAVEPAAMEDLQNVDLRAGAASLRKGLAVKASSFTGGSSTPTDVVAIEPVRSHGRGVAVTYDSVTGYCDVYLTDADGGAPTFLALYGITIAGGPLPRFVIADAYGRVIIAHDEQDFAFRMVTRCYNMDTLAVETMTLEGAGMDFRFRGVARHLNYIVGWGWGNNTTEQDRPELLRISLPGEPTAFLAAHYLLAGQRREPIINVVPCGDIAAVRKLTDSYQLVGYDRTTFGIKPLDPLNGLVQPLLSVSLGGVNYFWAESGPRVSDGGPSRDLDLPLDLNGPLPDALATIDLDNAFAVYDHNEREVLFVFGRWAYVLHLADAQPRWSYRKFGVALTAGGTLYADRLPPVGTAPTATVVFDPITPFASKANGIWTTNADCTGPFDPADQVETWIREVVGPFAGIWRKVNVTLVNSSTNLLIAGPSMQYAGQAIDIALRVCRAGVPGPLYTASSPLSWPAAARKAAEPDVLSAPVHNTHVWAANGGAPDTLDIDLTPVGSIGSTPLDDHITFQAEISDGVGGWIATVVAAYPLSAPDQFLKLSDVTAFAGLTRDVRIRHHTTWVNSAWTTIAGVTFA